MPLARHIFATSLALTLLAGAPGFSHAQTTQTKTTATKALTDNAAAIAGTSALRVYDNAMAECFKSVMNVDPLEAARTKNTASLNMDKVHFSRIQDCMHSRGIPLNMENYGSANNREGLSAAQRADLQAIQDGLNAGTVPAPATNAAPTPTPAPAPAPTPAPGAMTIIRADPQTSATPDFEAGGQGTVKTPRPANKYWVTPE